MILYSNACFSFQGRKSHIKIHEDALGGIYTVGVTQRPVTSLQDVSLILYFTK